MAITITRDLREINAELKETDRQIKSASKESRELANALKLDPSNVKVSTAYYKSLGDQLDSCQKKIELLREKQSSLVAANGPDARLTPEYQKLESEIGKCEATAKNLETRLQKVNKVDLKKLKSGLATVAKTAAALVASVVAIGAAFASSADEIQKAVDKYGGSAEEWQYAANAWDKVTGDSEAYASTLAQILTVQGQISKESSRVGTVLEQLGLSFDDFAGASATEALDIFMNALSGIADEADRQSIAVSLFGNTVGVYLAQMLGATTEEIESYNQALTEAGVLTSEQVASGADLQDTFDYLKQSLTALIAEMGDSLKPTIETLIDLLRSLMTLFGWVADAMAAIGPAGTIALGIFVSMMTLIPTLVQLMAALHIATGNIALAAAAYAALAAVIGAGAGIAIAAGTGNLSSSSVSTDDGWSSTYVDGTGFGSSGSSSGSSSSSTSETFEDNSTNNYYISSDADADAVIAKITKRRRSLMGRSR